MKKRLVCPKCNRVYDQDIITCNYCNCLLIEKSIQSKNNNHIFTASNELNMLKNCIVVYLVTVLLSAFLIPFVIIGVLFLAYGIYRFDNRYPTHNGKFLTSILVFYALYNLIPLYLVFTPLYSDIYSYLMFVSTGITFFVTIYFTIWFNKSLPQNYKQTYWFLYYGLVSFIGGSFIALHQFFYDNNIKIPFIGKDALWFLGYFINWIPAFTLFIIAIIIFINRLNEINRNYVQKMYI